MKNNDQNQSQAPRVRYWGKGADQEAPGSMKAWTFNLRNISEVDREDVAAHINHLIEEHNEPSKIIYTTLTGHTQEGRLFAEVVLLPVGDAIRVTLGDEHGSPDVNDLRRVATYLFSAYLATVYDVPSEDVMMLCDLADEEAEQRARE